MKLTRNSQSFEPHPEYTGRAVCVDVTPLKEVETRFGKQNKFRIVFETEENGTDGKPLAVWSMGFTPSLHEKAGFRQFLKKWYGRDLSEVELDGFETEDLIGKPAFLVVVHEHQGDKTYANIASCTPHKAGEPLKPSGKFVRAQDRNKNSSYVKTEAPAGSEPVSGSNILATKVHVGRFAGIEVRELSGDAIAALTKNWLPTAKSNPKQTADDKRLVAALEFIVKQQQESQEPGSDPNDDLNF